jgi:hypothetical protein
LLVGATIACVTRFDETVFKDASIVVVKLEPGVPLICWAVTLTAAQQKEQGGRGQFEQTSILREFIRSIHVDRSFRGHLASTAKCCGF